LFYLGSEILPSGGGGSSGAQLLGALFTFGDNQYGQLGTGDNDDRDDPEAIQRTGVAMIAAGARHLLALGTDGIVRACGSNEYGQLGDTGTSDRNTMGEVGTNYQEPA
jgi:alpha-tubulin suppressor-like RCC1 family protein